MNEQLVLDLGEFAKNLQDEERFQAFVALYEQQLAADLLSTKPHEQKTREQIYASLQGFRGFRAFLKDFADCREKLLNPTVPDNSDDPSVHNIYEE